MYTKISYLVLICFVLLLSCKKDKIINREDLIGDYCGMVLEDADPYNFLPMDYFIMKDSRGGAFIIEEIDSERLFISLPSIFMHTDSLIFEIRENRLILTEQSYNWIEFCGSGCTETITEYYSGSGSFDRDEGKLNFQIAVSWENASGKDFNVPISIEMVKSDKISLPGSYKSTKTNDDIVTLTDDEFSDSLIVSISSDTENFVDESLREFKTDNFECSKYDTLIFNDAIKVFYEISYTNEYLSLKMIMKVYEEGLGYVSYPTYYFKGTKE